MKLNAKLYALVSRFAAVRDVREYLMHVRVEPAPGGGAILVATDGHRMIVALDREGAVDAPSLLPIVKTPARAATLTHADGRIDFNTGESFLAPLYEHRFVDWRVVVPFRGEPIASLDSINPELLATFSHVPKALGLSSGVGMRLTQFKAESAMLVTFTRTTDVFGVVMPLRPSVAHVGFAAACAPSWSQSG